MVSDTPDLFSTIAGDEIDHAELWKSEESSEDSGGGIFRQRFSLA
jgi:hypothetical protein